MEGEQAPTPDQIRRFCEMFDIKPSTARQWWAYINNRRDDPPAVTPKPHQQPHSDTTRETPLPSQPKSE